MSSQVQVLNAAAHLQLKLQADPLFSHAAQDQMLPVVLTEFGQLACEYPLVFVKNADTGQLKAVALTSLQAGLNLFHQPTGWRASQIPQTLLQYPFTLLPDHAGQPVLAALLNSPLLSDSQGTPLFNPDGSASVLQQQLHGQLKRFLASLQQTQAFIQRLSELALFEAQTLQLADGTEIAGLYLISQAKLSTLPPEVLRQLQLSGELRLIYAHLLSLQHIEKLLRWSND